MYKKDDIVEVKCTYIHPWAVYYVVVDDENQQENIDAKNEPIRGMCHISQFSDGYVKDIKKYAEIGKTYRLQVLSYDPEKRHINLSYKSLYKEEPIKESSHIEESGEGFKDLSNNLSQWIDDNTNNNTNLNESE